MRRGRSRERRAAAQGAVAQLPFGQVRNPYAPMKVISDDQVEALHHASLRVLRDNGMEFQLPRAVEILRKAGAAVGEDGKRVHFDPEFIEEKLKTVPSRFTLHGRSSHRDLEFGGNTAIWGTVGSAPNVSDRERGRITGNFEDYKNLIRLSHALNGLHALAGYPVEPCDLEVPTRHLHALSAAVRLTDKPQFGYSIGAERMADGIEIVRIARGISREDLLSQPSIHTVVNSNSPLIYDRALLEGAIVMAELNQPVVYTPFTLSGAMAPVSVAGALVLQNAEALAGIVFSQCVNPGAPAVYGSFTSNVDMKSGSPAFGTPEYAKATIASGQLARRYNFPWRSSNATASNAADAQAAYEAQMSLWPVVLGQANYIIHGFGWLEGGLCASYEKFILDAEMVQMMQEFLKPLDTAEAELGLDAITEVGPGGHFFGCSSHDGALRDRLLQADAVGLAQLRELAGQRRGRDLRSRDQNLEATSRRLRGAAARPSHRRGARRFCGTSGGGRRRPGTLNSVPRHCWEMRAGVPFEKFSRVRKVSPPRHGRTCSGHPGGRPRTDGVG